VAEGERSLAIFIDFENLALGFQGRRERFDIARVLERMVEKGKIVAKKAYADWSRFSHFTHALHEAAIELIEIPRRAQSGKNSADIRLCVDAMDLAYSKEHINTFVILSGDSDFSPLVSKLKELGKHVIGLGMQESTSDLLRDNCDEFIYYEDLGQPPKLAPSLSTHLPDQKRKAFELLMESLAALRRENKDVLWSSMIKDTMKRKKPSFNETFHGYRTFSELLEDAKSEGLLDLETDKRSRTYVVTRFGPEMHGEAPAPAAGAAPGLPQAAGPSPVGGDMMPPGMGGGRKKSRRRRRRGQGAGAGGNNGSTIPGGAPSPVQGFQPVVIPSPGPVVGVEVATPPPAQPPAAREEPAAKRPPEPEPAPPPAPEPAREVAAAKAAEGSAEKPAPKTRTRAGKTTRQPAAPRARRSTRSTKAGKSEAPEAPAEAAPAADATNPS
jgi:uncharacterized protein (TIGR00288 family)